MNGEPAALEARRLGKRFKGTVAVEDLSFAIERGAVTGFLGPNGAGKTTTLRMLLGLIRPTHGEGLVLGRAYRDLERPIERVGAVLEAGGFHPGRTARTSLRLLCRANRLPVRRADEMLELVGLTSAARRRVGAFSLGMRQRLAIAGALVGDPEVLVLDEPANGLDPEGVRWIRELLRFAADQGKAVLVSSHVLAEVQQTVDRVLIINRGRLVREGSLTDVLGTGERMTLVRTPQPELLAPAVARRDAHLGSTTDGRLEVHGLEPAEVGEIAAAEGIVLHELTRGENSLERTYFDLIEGVESFESPEGSG